jgi:hypothetical protein
VTSSNAALQVVLCLVVSTNHVLVPEGGTNGFTVRLSEQPGSPNFTVNTTRSGGDTNLTVSSGATLVFKNYNWATPQQVTLSAAVDADALNGSATFTVSASGASNVLVTVVELDKDAPPQFTSISLSNGLLRLQVLGFPGSNYVLQASTNLAPPAWLSTATNTADGGGLVQFTNAGEPAFPQRFFRARRQ